MFAAVPAVIKAASLLANVNRNVMLSLEKRGKYLLLLKSGVKIRPKHRVVFLARSLVVPVNFRPLEDFAGLPVRVTLWGGPARALGGTQARASYFACAHAFLIIFFGFAVLHEGCGATCALRLARLEDKNKLNQRDPN